MTTSTFRPSDSASQSVAAWFPTVDGDIAVVGRLAAAFAPHETTPPTMTVALAAGALMAGASLVEIAAQTSTTIAAPTTDPRIDRIVIDRITGAISVVTGTEAAAPVPPALPVNSVPVARVELTPATTSITNALIVDERVAPGTSTSIGSGLIGVQRFSASGTYVPTPGTKTVIVEVQGAGGSAGGCPATGAGQGTASAGGASGAYGRSTYPVNFSSVAVTVGVGGASPAAGGNVGNNGSASSFGTLLVCPGGDGGLAGVAGSGSVIGGASPAAQPTGANIIGCPGSQGGHGICLNATWLCGGTGGASYFGGGGRAGQTNLGGNAPSPGAGGGGTSSQQNVAARSAGRGGDGLVIVHEFG